MTINAMAGLEPDAQAVSPRKLQLLAAVPRSLLFDLGIGVEAEANLFMNVDGLTLDEVEKAKPEWLKAFEDNMVWRTREALEKDLTLVHFIPYLLLHDGKGKVFHYQRTKKVGESKLAGNRSIGLGGHMDVTPQVVRYVYNAKTMRNESHFLNAVMGGISAELYEEITTGGTCDLNAEIEAPEFRGFYYDDTEDNDGVGKVHLALVFTIKVKIKEDHPNGAGVERFYTNEEELISLQPYDLKLEVQPDFEGELEPWSKAMVEYAPLIGLV